LLSNVIINQSKGLLPQP